MISLLLFQSSHTTAFRTVGIFEFQKLCYSTLLNCTEWGLGGETFYNFCNFCFVIFALKYQLIMNPPKNSNIFGKTQLPFNYPPRPSLLYELYISERNNIKTKLLTRSKTKIFFQQ